MSLYHIRLKFNLFISPYARHHASSWFDNTSSFSSIKTSIRCEHSVAVRNTVDAGSYQFQINAIQLQKLFVAHQQKNTLLMAYTLIKDYWPFRGWKFLILFHYAVGFFVCWCDLMEIAILNKNHSKIFVNKYHRSWLKLTFFENLWVSSQWN